MISVIIVNWNKKDLLNNCLKSLLAQTHKDFEVIVVDNGSSDGSVELVKKGYPDARLICLAENKGFSIGNNIGIKSSTSEYIALLNNDMEAHPEWLQSLYAALTGNPGIGFCASRILDYKNREIIDSAGDIFYPFGLGKKRGNLQKDSRAFACNKEVFGACAGAALYRRQMLEKIGLFDEKFSPAYYEDVDLSFRAQLKGYKCLYVAGAICYHYGHSSLGLFSSKHLYFSNRNIGYVLIKNMPSRLLLRYGFEIILYNIVSFLGHIHRGGFRPFLFGKIEIFKNLRYLSQQRKLIQDSRVVSDEYIDSILTHYSPVNFFIDGYKRLFFNKNIL